MLDDVRWGNVANWRTLGKTSAVSGAGETTKPCVPRLVAGRRKTRNAPCVSPEGKKKTRAYLRSRCLLEVEGCVGITDTGIDLSCCPAEVSEASARLCSKYTQPRYSFVYVHRASKETPAKKAQNALAQREKDAERNSRELLQMLDDEKAASISKSKKKKKKKKSPSKSKWGRDNGVGAAAAASAAGAGASTGAAGGCGFGGGADGVDSPDEGDGDSASLRSVSSVVSVSSYTSAAAALAHEKNKELQDRLSSLGQVLRDEKDLKQQAHREHSTLITCAPTDTATAETR